MLSIDADQHQKQTHPHFPQITFQTSDLNTNVTNLDDPVVISLQLGDLLLKKVLLDPGSSADVLFYSTFQKMKLSSNILQPSTGDLVSFSDERVPVMGSVWLQTTLGEDNTTATIHSDAREARECYNSFKRPNQNTQAHVHNIGTQDDLPALADLDPREGTLERPTPIEDLHKIYFADSSNKFTYVRSTLSSEEKALFRAFLHQNADLFAWTPADIPGIDPCIISHKLALDPSVQPVAQKKRNLSQDRKQASLEETKKLINAGATYQCLMDRVFAKQLGRNIEVYVDDMITKTKIGNNHLDDLAEIFGQIRKYIMRLNPEKCAFGVQSGKFLGFMLTSRERHKQQLPIYFISKTLQNAKLRYPSIEKLALALVFSARRLRPYFQSHVIHSQFLADFIAEFSVPDTAEDYVKWSLYVDGSSNPQGCRAGIILHDSHGNIIKHSLHFSFKASNNQSEYEVLIAGLRLVADLHITKLKVYCDSLLIVQQIIDRQFADHKFTSFLQDLKIKYHFSSVEHPQTNGLAEAANKVILHSLRKKLEDAKGLWAELIPEIIWGYNTTIHSTTKETPFLLVYSSDAMIPVEISQASLRTQLADHTTAHRTRQTDLDLVEEVRASAAITHRAMQQHIAWRYNQKLHPRSFQVNDLVLKKTEQARKPRNHGKLAANWEGLLWIIEVIGNGAYRLQTLYGNDLPNTWNVSSLKLYYS
ncbi:uncharacterized protein [Arachis hypogaea]|uniref:uncharacterized protein n=1 Tax=Arachis hypogaea TaxID=3818 RepID=UPI003B20E7AD